MPIRPHSAPASCAAPSPDGRLIASGSYDKRVLLWDASTGIARGELCGHTSLVNGLGWSPDGERLASASSDYTVRVWNVAAGREEACLRGHTDDVNSVAWSPDGERLATASFDGTVRVWSPHGHCTLIAGHHHSDVNGVAWLPGGARLAAASDDGTVSIFDAADGRLRNVLRGHTDWVDQVAPHPDGRRIASAGQDGTARVWDVETGRQVACLDESACVVKAVAWSRDGHELGATSYDGTVRVYDARSLQLQQTLFAEGLWNRTLHHTPDGWLTGSFGGGPILMRPDGVRRLGPATTAGLNGFVVAPDGERVAVCSDDGNLYQVGLRSGSVERVLGSHPAAVLCAAWSPCGERIATGSWDRTVRLWDARSGRMLDSWAGKGDPVNALVFGDDGASLWIGSFNGEVLRWRLDSGEVRDLGTHHGSVKALAGIASGVVSVGRDATVRRWTESGSRELAVGGSILNGVAVEPGGGRTATVSRREGVELRSADGEMLDAFRDHPCSAKAVAWSPDGSRVAGVYYDGHLCLWAPGRSRARVERVSDHSLSMVAFAGNELLVSAWDEQGSLLRLDARTGEIAKLETAA